LASLNIPRSAGTSASGCSDDRGIDPGFSPKFAFFTYGAPHRNGLNQYGARARAVENQKYEEILNFYYTDFQLSDFDPNYSIIINGINEYGQVFENETMGLEDYIKHLYEMPADWPIEALKAQAVAARTYALRIIAVHGSIQPNQGHQVVKKELNSQGWIDAVDQTAGRVMLRGGEPFLSEYASTHGGYVLNLEKFDGRVGNPGSFTELNERAYDRESPWFYCDWGYRSGHNNTAWLKSEELADIVNVILLARKDANLGDHLYQTDKPHPYGGELWNEDRVKQELKTRGTNPFGSISSVAVSVDFGSGKTTGISLSGDVGSVSFSGEEFKSWFNLRAPANIQIVGPLYNVEQ
jgi:peptidoglycan hydrolase-like amidase